VSPFGPLTFRLTPSIEPECDCWSCVTLDRMGMVYHYDIPAISMNGCLSLTSGVPMWLACDVRTRRDHHPTWKFESMPGPSLAAVFDNDEGGPRRPTPPGMLRFQQEMDSQITVCESSSYFSFLSHADSRSHRRRYRRTEWNNLSTPAHFTTNRSSFGSHDSDYRTSLWN